MSRRRPFALWLPPPSPAAARLTVLIEALAQRLGSEPFAPHVTLWGRVDLPEHEARERGARLAREVPVLELRATGLGFLDEFYRALFLPVAASRPLWDAYRRASERFAASEGGLSPSLPPFLPHLSLAYTRRPLHERMAAAQKEVTASGLPDFLLTVTELVLIDAQGGPSQWAEVARFPLTGA